MSLLNHHRPSTNEQFLNKINFLYSKKGSASSMSSYEKIRNIGSSHDKNKRNPDTSNDKINKPLNDHFPHQQNHPNPITSQVRQLQQKWDSVQQELIEIIKQFGDKVKLLLQSIHQEGKYYNLLSIIRKNQLLSDLSSSISQELIRQNFTLKNELSQARQHLGELSKMVREQQSVAELKANTLNNGSIKSSFNPKIDTTRPLAQNIFINAQSMKQSQFTEWCDRILMKNKLVITNLKKDVAVMNKTFYASTDHPIHRRSFSAVGQKHHDIQIHHPETHQKYAQLSKQIQQLSPLTEPKLFESQKSQILSALELIKLEKFTCPKFCCLPEKPNLVPESPSIQNRLSLTEKSRSKEKNVYRDNKMQEYFTRYYKRPEFSVDQVVSVEKTKAQQMTRLEDQYAKMLSTRSKFRYKC